MIGSRLAHYEITGHLGSGGMGDVYQPLERRDARVADAAGLRPDITRY